MSFIAALAAIGVEGTAGTIGAGALMGAGLGATTSAITGGDPAQGALMGGLTGGIGGGISGGLQALAPVGGFGSDIASGMGGIGQAGESVAGMSPLPEAAGSNLIAPNATGGLGSGMLNTLNTGDAALANSAIPGTATAGGTEALNAASPMSSGLGIGGGTLNSLNTGDAALAANAPGPAIDTSARAPLSMTDKIGSWAVEHPNITSAGASLIASPFVNNMFTPDTPKPQGLGAYNGPLSYYKFDPTKYKPTLPSGASTSYVPSYATGGITDLDTYQSNSQVVPEQGTLNVPNPLDVADPEGYVANSTMSYAKGGITNLGSYATGGIPNLLQGPGDGVSDSLQATIGGRQPARLAAGEYVVPSRIVSELGNGSTDAGAKRLDEMVKKIQAGRRHTTKGKNFAKDTHAYKHLPA